MFESKRRPRALSLGNPIVRETLSQDIEDSVLEFSQIEDNELYENLAEASPKLILLEDMSKETFHQYSPASPHMKEYRENICNNCLSADCITVKPTVGYYPWSHISTHCTLDDCWIVSHGFVYDVTRYYKKHPGGAKSILNRAGTDVSTDFDFHTKLSQKKLWPKYKIGKVTVCTRPTKTASRSQTPTNENYDESCLLM